MMLDIRGDTRDPQYDLLYELLTLAFQLQSSSAVG